MISGYNALPLITNSKNRVLLKTRIADYKRDDKDKITRFSEVRGSQYCPNNSLLKASSTAKQRCETELKKDSFEARSSIVKINIVTVKYPPPKATTKNHAGDNRSSGGEKQIPARCKRSHLLSLLVQAFYRQKWVNLSPTAKECFLTDFGTGTCSLQHIKSPRKSE